MNKTQSKLNVLRRPQKQNFKCDNSNNSWYRCTHVETPGIAWSRRSRDKFPSSSHGTCLRLRQRRQHGV
ncbi:hypothetical protein ACLKA6_005121 [Drosophila palustris]